MFVCIIKIKKNHTLKILGFGTFTNTTSKKHLLKINKEM